MMVAIVFLGFGWCALQGKHVQVDLFVSHYSPGTRRVIDLIVNCVGLVLVAVICWRTSVATLMVQRLGIICSYIGVPKYPFYALTAFGWVVLLIVMASLFFKNKKDGAER
jgi:TRAP-type C4-dicarboxylate transport system permease small subunit